MALIPENLARGFVKAGKKQMRRAQHPDIAQVLDRTVRHEGFDRLDGHTYALLVTYKRDGQGVPQPVWFARSGPKLYVWTEINAYKAKRLRRDPRALLAPCGPTGQPLGDPIAATGRILESPAERAEAARVIRGHWGPGRRIFERLSRPLTEVHYLEFVPAATPG